ncbi:Uncharacterised protein [Mycobacteroides abscessus subsp. bolletii]|nr:Uncharacterised protein [Mycobacteroides abscessus subsp. bolletii]
MGAVGHLKQRRLDLRLSIDLFDIQGVEDLTVVEGDHKIADQRVVLLPSGPGNEVFYLSCSAH